ncbi:MAG: efflux RND transporter periplasmic adaptor subunit [Planctomycetaceae bacterium]
MGRAIRFAVNLAACAVILGVAIGGFLFLLKQRPAPEKREVTDKVYNVQVFDAEARNLQEIIGAFGTARADREVVVPAQVAGEIKDIHPNLRVGLKIKTTATQSLAEIDKRPYLERRNRAQKQIDQTDTEIAQLDRERQNNDRLLAKAKKDLRTIAEQYARVKKNKDRGAGSASEVTRALLEVRQYEQTILQLENASTLIPIRLEAAKKRQESQKADLKLAMLDVENTTVRPPFDGTVSEVMVEKGQYVRTGDPLLRLTNTKLVEIPLPLALTDFLKIERQLRDNQKPEVDLALNETAPPQWRGRVVRASPEADAGTRTAMVFVEVENVEVSEAGESSDTNPTPLRPGTFLHARISGPLLANTIVIPRDAVIKGESVFVAINGIAEQRKVELGTRLQSLVVVEQGLKSGDQVLLTNLDVVQDGAKLTISDHVMINDELAKKRTAAARLLPSGD